MHRGIFGTWSCAAVLIAGATLAGCGTMKFPFQGEPDAAAAAPSAPAPTSSQPGTATEPGAAPQPGGSSPPGTSLPAAASSTAGSPSQPDAAAQAPAPVQPPAPPQLQAAQRDLAEGIKLFNQGDFNAAIIKLGSSPDIPAAAIDIRITALKYIAFSFCVSKRQVQCQAQFENALKLDPAFGLAPAERGHPLWGPVFERAKKARQARSK